MKMNKEKFHNELAMRLGYERIVKDKRIIIQVDDSDDPWVSLKFQGCPEVVRFKASDETKSVAIEMVSEIRSDVKIILDSVHQAYLEANKPF